MFFCWEVHPAILIYVMPSSKYNLCQNNDGIQSFPAIDKVQFKIDLARGLFHVLRQGSRIFSLLNWAMRVLFTSYKSKS